MRNEKTKNNPHPKLIQDQEKKCGRASAGCVYTSMEGLEFNKDQGKVCIRLWREENEGENYIVISKKFLKKNIKIRAEK